MAEPKIVQMSMVYHVEIDTDIVRAIRLVLESGKVQATKLARAILLPALGFGLKESKYFVDAIQDGEYQTAGSQEPWLTIVTVVVPGPAYPAL